MGPLPEVLQLAARDAHAHKKAFLLRPPPSSIYAWSCRLLLLPPSTAPSLPPPSLATTFRPPSSSLLALLLLRFWQTLIHSFTPLFYPSLTGSCATGPSLLYFVSAMQQLPASRTLNQQTFFNSFCRHFSLIMWVETTYKLPLRPPTTAPRAR